MSVTRPRYWSGDVRLDPSILLESRQGYTTAMHFLKANADWNTLITIYNYWTWLYKLQGITVEVRFVDNEGRVAVSREVHVPPHGSAVVDARAWLEGMDFEGEAVFVMKAEGLFPENPIQLIADYVHKDSISSVHGQGGLVDYDFSQRLHMIAVREHDGWRTSFDVKNHHIQIRSEEPVAVDLYDEKGRSLRATIPVPAPGAGRRYFVDEVFPEAASFLRGRAGHLRVTSPYKMHRIFYMQEHAGTGAISVNHGTVEHNHNYPEWSGIPGDVYRELGCAPVSVGPVVEHAGMTSGLTVINTMGPPEAPRRVTVDLFPGEGAAEPQLALEFELVPGESRTIDFADLVPEGFLGHARVWLRHRDDREAYPRQVDCIPYVRRHGFEAATHVGSGAFNLAQDNDYFRQLKTRIFARLQRGRTQALLIYPTCGHASPEASDTQVTLLRPDGQSMSAQVSVPRNGVLRLDVPQLFPDYDGQDEVFTLRLEDRTVRLIAFHLTEHPGSGALAMDHFFGG